MMKKLTTILLTTAMFLTILTGAVVPVIPTPTVAASEVLSVTSERPVTRRVETAVCHDCGVTKSWNVTTRTVTNSTTGVVTVTERRSAKRNATGGILAPCFVSAQREVETRPTTTSPNNGKNARSIYDELMEVISPLDGPLRYGMPALMNGGSLMVYSLHGVNMNDTISFIEESSALFSLMVQIIIVEANPERVNAVYESLLGHRDALQAVATFPQEVQAARATIVGVHGNWVYLICEEEANIIEEILRGILSAENQPAPTANIAISPSATHAFPTQTAGYRNAGAHTIIVSNTGGQPTGSLTIALSGANASSFILGTTTLRSVEGGGTRTLSVAPRAGLSAGTHTATVRVSGAGLTARTFDVRFVVEACGTGGRSCGLNTCVRCNPPPICGVSGYRCGESACSSCNPPQIWRVRIDGGDVVFPQAVEGYGSKSHERIAITNTGNQPTGQLTITLSGENPEAFQIGTLDENSITINSLAIGESRNRAVEIRPRTNLPIGFYTALVTVSGANIQPQSFNVTFAVISRVVTTININPQNFEFPNTFEGSEPPPPLTVTVTNTGNNPTGALTVSTTSSMPGSIQSSRSSLSSIAPGESATFTVQPNRNLTPSTYTATIRVYNTTNGISQSITVSYTVAMVCGVFGLCRLDSCLRCNPIIPPTHSVGDIIRFDNYDWRILDRQGDRALIITDRVIDQRDYHNTLVDVTWETSNIRTWLNNDFLNSFSATNRARILQTTLVNNDNQWYGTTGGANTTDRVFLLSLDEVVRYFGDSGQLANRPTSLTHHIRDEFNELRTALCANGSIVSWWLRSPGANNQLASFVWEDFPTFDSGDVLVVGSYVGGIQGGFHGVRPAMWINIG